MVTTRQVQDALRQLRIEANLAPEEFADEAAVGRATVYRIENQKKVYAAKIETISALVASRGLTLSAFFARIEGLPARPLSEYDRASTSKSGETTTHAPSVPSAAALTEKHLVAISANIADAIDRGVERLAALLSSGEQAPAPRVRTSKRPAAHRTSRRSATR
jgi:transcriptional regulator with XRE-family HTH domain